jgi:flagellar M-ring protein FliF
VTADINFQRHREKKETYSPEGRVAQKESITTTKQNSAAASKGGAAGTSSNVGKGGNAGSPSGSNNSEEKIETDYVLSKITQELEDKAGSIERLTVAALVDLAPSDEQGKPGEARMTLVDVQDIIKQAVGFKKGRDDIKVTEVKLSGAIPPLPPVEEGPETLQKWQNIVSVVKNAALGVAALAGLLMVWMVLRRLKPSAGHRTAQDKSPVLDRLSSAARRDPQAIAQILTKWLDKSEQSRRMAA